MSERDSEQKLSRRINVGVAWAAASQTIVAVSDMISQLVVGALWLSSAQLGTAMAVVPLYSILDAASDSGVTSALIQRDDHTPDRVSTVFWFNVIVSTILSALLLVIGPIYAHVLEPSPALDVTVVQWLLIAYAGKLFAQNFYAIPYAMLRKRLQFEEIAKVRTVAYLTESITRVVFAMIGLEVWCFTLAAIAKAVMLALLVQWRHPYWPRWVFRWREIREFVAFGVRSATSQLLYYTYTNLDYPIVTFYFGVEANGIYALAYWIVLEAVKTIANVIIDVAFPAFARLRDDRIALVREFIKLTRLSLIAILTVVVIIALIAPEFLRMIYGGGNWSRDQLSLGADAARILCIVGVLRALGYVGPPLLDAIGKPGRTLRYMIVASIFVPLTFVVCAQLLGPSLGFRAVAVAWAIGYPIAFAALIYLIVHSIDLSLAAYVRATAGIFACAAGSLAVGIGVDWLARGRGDGLRLAAVGGSAAVVMIGSLALWQGVTPGSIGKSLKS